MCSILGYAGKWLLLAGREIQTLLNIQNLAEDTALHLLCWSDRNYDMVQQLLDLGSDITLTNGYVRMQSL